MCTTVTRLRLCGASFMLVMVLSCREVDVVTRPVDGGIESTLCGGHGRWELTDAGATCRCEPGFHARTPGWCEPIGLETGCSNAWCAPGEGCEFESARCVTLAPDHCGRTTEPVGISTSLCQFDSDAGVADHCIAGLVCVSKWANADSSTGTLKRSGVCMTACDPCAPTCATTDQCVALPGRGGFCTSNRLSGLNEVCIPGVIGPPQVCAGSLVCDPFICVKPCLPDEPAHQAPGRGELGTGFASRYCAEHELCQVINLSTDFVRFGCGGPVTPVGGACAGVCPWPAQCRVGLCTYDCQETPCPSGVDCFFRAQQFLPGGGSYSCIRDNVVSANLPCVEDRNCVSSLVCRAQTDGGDRRCTPP